MANQRFSWDDSVLYSDDDFLIINKPPFMSSLSDRVDETNLLELGRSKAGEELRLAHRLDKNTSGALVFCKNDESYRHLSMLFEGRKVEKVYHALSDGVHEFQNRKVDLAIYDTKKGIMKIDPRRGKASLTHLQTLKAYSRHSLIECRPRTGRTHQIRVHLSALGAPITGDDRYGGRPFYLSEIKRNFNLKKYTEEEPLIKRMALHALSIGFEGPNGKKVKAEAPYPKDFQVMIKQLDKNS